MDLNWRLTTLNDKLTRLFRHTRTQNYSTGDSDISIISSYVHSIVSYWISLYLILAHYIPWYSPKMPGELHKSDPAARLCAPIQVAEVKEGLERQRPSGPYWMIEGSFRSQTSDNMDRWKSRGGKSQRGEAKKWEDQRRERVKRKKMQVREKVGMSRFTVFFYGGSKSRLAKAAGAEPAGQMRDEKLHAVVAWSTFPSQSVQSTPGSHHFWKLRRRKSARSCGAKHISKSKVSKTDAFGTLLEVLMSKKAYFAVARSTCPSKNVQSTPRSAHFWKLRGWKSGRRCGAKQISKSKCTKHTRFGPLLDVQMPRCCGAKHISNSKV